MYDLINKICQFRQDSPGTLKTNDPKVKDVKKNLKKLARELEVKGQELNVDNFECRFSQGQGIFPNVLHVCILPEEQQVSNGIYTAICFDVDGKGIVAGCAQSVTKPKGLKVTKRLKRGVVPDINVDGTSSDTKYNNAFYNPKEFYYPLNSDSIEDFIEHVAYSLQLSLYFTGQPDSCEICSRDVLNSPNLNTESFILSNVDTRERILQEVVVRRGQQEFREELISVYNSRCAITCTNIKDILEAAHIFPYKGSGTNVIANGILLRSDIHTLFDLDLLGIDENDCVVLSKQIKGDSYYSKYEGKKVNFNKYPSKRPSKGLLSKRYNQFLKNNL